MRLIAFLLALAAAVTGVLAVLIGLMAAFTDNPHAPAQAWGYGLTIAATVAVALAVLSAAVIWIAPRFAAKLLWAASAAAVAGMAIQGVIMFLVRNNPNAPGAYNIFTAIMLSGAAPALFAATAALLMRRYSAATR